ncbi:MAG: hypothetical protein JWN67_325 [Actinomycetia bacterium]|nr:hypothetical protein [Actinomycetes bacterium]
MTRGRIALLATVLVVVVAALAIGRHGDGSATDADRPTHLLDQRAGTIQRIQVQAPGSGSAMIERRGGSLVVIAGDALTDAQLRQLDADLSPLLAIRLLGRRRPDYGLDPPRLTVTVTAAGRRTRLLVGGPNFDGTAAYVDVGGRTALVLPRIAATLAAATGQTAP